MKKHTFQKLLSVALSVVMLLGTLTVLPLSAGAADAQLPAAWDGTTYDYTWYTKDGGTAASPYLIGSPAALAGLSALSNGTQNASSGISGIVSLDGKYIKLTADLNMGSKNFTPIKGGTIVYDTIGEGSGAVTYVKTLTGAVHFDGDNHTIYNMTAYGVAESGLFAVAGHGSELKNVKFVGADVDGAATSAVLVGRTSSCITVTNVHVDATSTVDIAMAKDREPGAGIIGYIDDLANQTGKATISYCSNAGKISGMREGAGIVGRVGGYVDTDISFCANTGAITASMITKDNGDRSEVNVGGIVGNLRHTTLTTYPFVPADTNSQEYKDFVGCTLTITDCYNTGALTGTADANQYISLGGIIGRKWGQDGSNVVVKDCYDYSYRFIGGGKTLHAGILGNGRADCYTWLSFSYCFPAPNPTDETDYGTAYPIVYEPLAADIDSTTRYFTESIALVGGLGENITKSDGTKLPMIDAINAINTKLGLAHLEVEGVVFDDPASDYSWYTAEGGTEAAPYQIATPAQWAGLVELSRGTQAEDSGIEGVVDFNGKYIVLTADLDFSEFAGIRPLGGDFATLNIDGKGHAISNLNMTDIGNVALIGSIGNGSKIANIKIANSNFKSQATKAAALVAVSKANITITNCHVDENSTVASGNGYASGILAHIDDNATTEGKTVINYCTNGADVTGRDTVGGIVSRYVSLIEGLIEYCVNTGDIEALESNYTQHAAGILTYIAGSKESKIVTINHCYNTGKQTVRVKGLNNYIMCAGILARQLDNTSSELYMTNCHDIGAKDVEIKEGNKPSGAYGVFAQGYQEIYREFYNCYAMNPEDTITFMSGVNTATTFISTYEVECGMVESLDEEIVNCEGEKSTIAAEMAKIDDAIKNLVVIDPTKPAPSEPDPEQPKPEDPKPEDNKKDDDTTKAPDTTAAPSGGCGSSVTATFAVVAMTALCGMAIVGKKKED